MVDAPVGRTSDHAWRGQLVVMAGGAPADLARVQPLFDLMGETTVERAGSGDKPAGSITDTLTLYGKIVGVDKAAGTVTIKGAETTRTFNVDDPALLDEVAVGDGVVANFRNTITGQVTVK